jgi:hypothetical protein
MANWWFHQMAILLRTQRCSRSVRELRLIGLLFAGFSLLEKYLKLVDFSSFLILGFSTKLSLLITSSENPDAQPGYDSTRFCCSLELWRRAIFCHCCECS